MKLDPLATPCGLYCGSCRYYMNHECKGCGSEDRAACAIYHCCRTLKHLYFCTECDDFPCVQLSQSIGLDSKWLEDQAQYPAQKWDVE